MGFKESLFRESKHYSGIKGRYLAGAGALAIGGAAVIGYARGDWKTEDGKKRSLLDSAGGLAKTAAIGTGIALGVGLGLGFGVNALQAAAPYYIGAGASSLFKPDTAWKILKDASRASWRQTVSPYKVITRTFTDPTVKGMMRADGIAKGITSTPGLETRFGRAKHVARSAGSTVEKGIEHTAGWLGKNWIPGLQGKSGVADTIGSYILLAGAAYSGYESMHSAYEGDLGMAAVHAGSFVAEKYAFMGFKKRAQFFNFAKKAKRAEWISAASGAMLSVGTARSAVIEAGLYSSAYINTGVSKTGFLSAQGLILKSEGETIVNEQMSNLASSLNRMTPEHVEAFAESKYGKGMSEGIETFSMIRDDSIIAGTDFLAEDQTQLAARAKDLHEGFAKASTLQQIKKYSGYGPELLDSLSKGDQSKTLARLIKLQEIGERLKAGSSSLSASGASLKINTGLQAELATLKAGHGSNPKVSAIVSQLTDTFHKGSGTVASAQARQAARQAALEAQLAAEEAAWQAKWDAAYNPRPRAPLSTQIEGLPENGMAADLRHKTTGFGSPWKGPGADNKVHAKVYSERRSLINSSWADQTGLAPHRFAEDKWRPSRPGGTSNKLDIARHQRSVYGKKRSRGLAQSGRLDHFSRQQIMMKKPVPRFLPKGTWKPQNPYSPEVQAIMQANSFREPPFPRSPKVRGSRRLPDPGSLSGSGHFSNQQSLVGKHSNVSITRTQFGPSDFPVSNARTLSNRIDIGIPFATYPREITEPFKPSVRAPSFRRSIVNHASRPIVSNTSIQNRIDSLVGVSSSASSSYDISNSSFLQSTPSHNNSPLQNLIDRKTGVNRAPHGNTAFYKTMGGQFPQGHEWAHHFGLQGPPELLEYHRTVGRNIVSERLGLLKTTSKINASSSLIDNIFPSDADFLAHETAQAEKYVGKGAGGIFGSIYQRMYPEKHKKLVNKVLNRIPERGESARSLMMSALEPNAAPGAMDAVRSIVDTEMGGYDRFNHNKDVKLAKETRQTAHDAYKSARTPENLKKLKAAKEMYKEARFVQRESTPFRTMMSTRLIRDMNISFAKKAVGSVPAVGGALNSLSKATLGASLGQVAFGAAIVGGLAYAAGSAMGITGEQVSGVSHGMIQAMNQPDRSNYGSSDLGQSVNGLVFGLNNRRRG